MKIALENISKKYNREYIFRELSYQFESGKSYAITGANGSGKSTLVQVISAYVRPTAGQIIYDGGQVDEESIFQHISIVAPYLELVEEFTLTELIDFHLKFKKTQFSREEIISKAYLEDAKNKFVKNFSSGMKQRLKLALALFTDSQLLLLDEPTSNLDEMGVKWYNDQIQTICREKNQTIIIASNQQHEYAFCDSQLNIENFKN